MFRAIHIPALAMAVVLAAAGAEVPRVAAKPAPPRQLLPAPRPAAAGQAKSGAGAVSGAPTRRTEPGLAALDRWNQMSPQQRERALAKLPPEKQRAVRERLDRWNRLTPQEKERLRARYERFSHLPSDRQALVRRQIESFAKLSDHRRPMVSREFDGLRRLDEPERRARVNSEEFRSRFTPREQEILRDLAENMNIPSRQNVQAGR